MPENPLAMPYLAGLCMQTLNRKAIDALHQRELISKEAGTQLAILFPLFETAAVNIIIGIVTNWSPEIIQATIPAFLGFLAGAGSYEILERIVPSTIQE